MTATVRPTIKCSPRTLGWLMSPRYAPLIALLAFACGREADTTDTGTPTTSTGMTPADTTDTTGPTHPVYVTVAGHIEDNPLYHQDCAEYEKIRASLVQLGEHLDGTGAAFHLQASYEWFLGTQACETDALRAETDGLGVLDYLATAHDFTIDAHQEGASLEGASSGNNFADIRFLGGQVTSYMSETTGFQWDNPRQYEALQAGERGLLHPEFTWRPEVLAGGVSTAHTGGDFSRDMTSVGVWIPSDFTEDAFHVHDTTDAARMVYIGSGPNQFCDDWNFVPDAPCHFHSTADFVELLVAYKDAGQIDPEGLYTTTLFVPGPVMFDPAEHTKISDIIRQLLPLVDAGQVAHAHFQEVAET